MIVGLTGRNGSGKGTVAAWFETLGFFNTSLSDAIRRDLRERGLRVTRENLIAGGRRMRTEGGPGVLAERTLASLPAGQHAVVDSIRNPAEVHALRARADFVLLEITANERTRFDRMVARKRGGDATTFEQFRAHEQAELNSTDSAAQQLDATGVLRDLTLSNDGGVEALVEQLRALFAGVSDAPCDLPRVDVLVTGGAGFVGAAACEALVDAGHSVRCLDLSGFARLDTHADSPDLSFVVGDVLNEPLVDALVQRAGKVLHLAAVVGVDRYLSEPEAVLDVNILGGRNVLRACADHGVPVVAASTSEVYGGWQLELREDVGPLIGDLANSRWSYALSKAATEQYAHALGKRGLCYAITRFFNVYGPQIDRPGQGRVLGKFLGSIQTETPLPLVEGGTAVRSFCFIDDAVRATVAIVLGLGVNPKLTGRAFNIGCREPVTIAKLADRVIALSGHSAGVQNVSALDHFGPGFEEIQRRVPDVSALREAIGFEAQISLDDGLRATLEHWGLLAPDTPERTRPAPMLPFIRPQVEPTPRLLGDLACHLTTGALTNRGGEVRAFEREMATFLGAAEAIATSSGSGALLQAALAIGATGKVILPSFTYIATLNAAVWAGLDPVFCDIDPHTWTMCPDALAALLREYPDAGLVIPVNVYGNPPDLARIAALATGHGAAMLYDNAHGLGTEQDGARLSPHAPLQVFSLHATKVLPAVEGGAIVASDPQLMADMRRLGNHGLAPAVRSSRPGFNFKMSELHAAVGRHSLRGLPAAIERRRTYAARIQAALDATSSMQPQRLAAGVSSNFQNLAATFVSDLTIDAISRKFELLGVGTRRYFHPPLHTLEMFRGGSALPITDDVCARLLCLPMWSRMAAAEVERIEAAIGTVATELAGTS